jgi:hypothetical protein
MNNAYDFPLQLPRDKKTHLDLSFSYLQRMYLNTFCGKNLSAAADASGVLFQRRKASV